MTGKGLLAFDPGKGGGLAIYRPSGKIDLRPWTVEHELLDVIDSVDPTSYEAVIEDVPAFVSAATSNASSFKLGYNFGFIVGCCRMHELPTHLVKPKEWQKGLSGLRANMGYAARKRQLKDNAVRLYPDLKITNATADAVLIMDFWKSKWTQA
tara:strand:+ start:3321 stop:3779 length:459 start_codon:yes stop_codon:yes gene_type:complete